MSKHTPGPWGYNMDYRIAPYGKIDGLLDLHHAVARVYAHGGQVETTKANARLIKAAPDMLETLDAVNDRIARGVAMPFGGLHHGLIRAVIAKVKGETE